MRADPSALRYTVKPKKTEHTSITGKTFYGTPAEFHLYNNLPFGRWTLADRREVLFNWFYEPMFQRKWTRTPRCRASCG